MQFKKWCRDYDIEKLSGIGSGCSYNQLYSWCKPAWDHQQSKIDALQKEVESQAEQIEEAVRIIETGCPECEERLGGCSERCGTRKFLDKLRNNQSDKE